MAGVTGRSPTKMLSSPLFAVLCLFFFFTSSALAASAVIGVDLGTEYIKAALVKPGIPLEIVLTKDSRRKETSAVAFKPAKVIKSGDFPERVYGSDAVALSARFPGDVYPNLKRLLGLGADNSIVQEYAKRHPALHLETEKTRGTAAFKSGAFADDEQPWMVEEILAMELQSIQRNAEALAGKGSVIKDLVVTVPAFFSTEEKRAVELAADLAGLRILELISDGLAVGLNYATSRTFASVNDGVKPEFHLVFDMGAGSTKATILQFQGRTVKDIGKFNKTIQEVRVVGSGWDRTLGGDALNAVIVDDMIAKFVAFAQSKGVVHTAEAVQGHGRAAAKLWKEAERIRHILSANQNTAASFEGLYEDMDFKYKITRDEFENLTEEHRQRAAAVMQKALDTCDKTIADIDSIILHGGAIRTPFVQKELEKFAGSAKIKTNVNADESAVFGAGFRGAALSPSFRVKDIRAYEGASYAAGFKWIDINEKPKHLRLWQPTSNLGVEKEYSFQNNADPFKIQFYQHVPSGEDVSKGSAEKELLEITTQNLTESVALCKSKYGCTDGDIRVKMTTRLAPSNGEVEILKFVLECQVEHSEKESMVDSVKGLFGFGKKDQAPLADSESSEASTSTSTTEGVSSSTSSSASKSATPSGKDEKEPKVKRVEIIPIKHVVEIKGLPQLPAAELTRMKDRIIAFDDSDRSRRLREEALNQLEGFTYKARDLLNDAEFIAVATEAERTSLEEKSKSASDWIYSGGSDASRDELKQKLTELRDIVNPIQFRKEEAVARPVQLKSLQEALEQTKTIIEGITGQIENDTKAHSSFSSSISAAKTATTTVPSSTDDFEGLDDAATTTTTAAVEEKTLAPMVYTEADLALPKSLLETTAKWLDEKLTLQSKLGPTDDPVLHSKDMAEKAKILQDNHVDLIMKSMQQKPPVYSGGPKPRKPTSTKTSSSKATAKAKKPKTKKAKKDKSSKTASAKKGEKTEEAFVGEDMKKKMFDELKMGEDGEMPSEEEILAFLERNKFEMPPKTEENGESGGEGGERIVGGEFGAPTDEAKGEEAQAHGEEGEKKHDEL